MYIFSDHRLYQKHLKKAASNFFKSRELDIAMQLIMENLPFKGTLFALYAIVWIWGLIGNFSILENIFFEKQNGSFLTFPKIIITYI